MNTIDRNSDIEAVLRSELAVRADALEAVPPPYANVRRAVRRDRGRRLAGATAGLALAAALVVTLTQVLGGGSGSTVGAAAGAPSPLLTVPTRGNLAGDSDFVTAAKWRLDTSSKGAASARPLPGSRSAAAATSNGYSILYANDDGTHRVVIGATYDGRYTLFTELVGAHGDSVPALKQSDSGGAQTPDETFTFVGEFTENGDSVPFVVLGPLDMTNAEYATGVTLAAAGGKLDVVRSHVAKVTTVDGVAAGEIPGAHSMADVVRMDLFTVFRAQINGRYVDADQFGRASPALPGTLPTGPAYTAIKAAVAQKGRAAGLSMNTDSPGGDAAPDNVAAVMLDLAQFDGVPISSLTYQVDWVGRETAQWDAALVDVQAPGLPPMQIFVRGLTAGAPDSASPGLAHTFVRPATPLTPGHVPHTAAAFGGTPEPGVFGYQLMTTW